jgi:hypothetical protein
MNHIPFTPPLESMTLDDEVLNSAVNSYPKNEYWLDAIKNMVLFNTFSFYSKNNKSDIAHYLEMLKNHKNAKNQDFLLSLLEDSYNMKEMNTFEMLLNWNIKFNGIEILPSGTLSWVCIVRAGAKNFTEALHFCELTEAKCKACNVSLLNNLLFINYNLKKMSVAKEWGK